MPMITIQKSCNSDFVLCKFFTEKWRIAMYVGMITSVGVEYEVKFLRKSY